MDIQTINLDSIDAGPSLKLSTEDNSKNSNLIGVEMLMNEKKKPGADSLTNGGKDVLASSAIDGEMDMESGEEISPYYCRHCFTASSKNWHHGGKEKLLLCADCRVYFKCYGKNGTYTKIERPIIIIRMLQSR